MALRVKRLIDLFPNYNHKILTWANVNEHFKRELEQLGITIQQNNDSYNPFLYYIPPAPVGMVVYNLYFSMYFDATVYTSCFKKPLGIDIEPRHPEWQNFDETYPYIPGLQCKIFQAIYGSEWIKHVTIRLNGYEKSLSPLEKEKLL